MPFDISIMSDSDIDFAHNLTDIENWGYLKDDIKRLTEWEPDGCFIARQDGKRAGMITTTTYDDYAFLGCLIVDKPQRGKGISRELMKHAVEYLNKKSAKTMELDGVLPAAPLYRSLGFKDKYLSLRLTRPASASGSDLQACPPDLVNEIISFDKALIGINRERVIKHYFKRLPECIFALSNRGIRAYAMVRPRSDGKTAIGPFVCKTFSDAEKLLDAIIGKFGDRPISIGVPVVNQEAVELAVEYGFLYGQPSLRMYQGECRRYEKHIYGIFSAEKG